MRMTWMRIVYLLLVAGLPGTVVAAASVAPADMNTRAGFDQHPGAALPWRTTVVDSEGNVRSLASIAGGRPVILAFGYYRCPNLCDLILHGLIKTLGDMRLDASADYRVVFVSIDPRETAADARAARTMLAGMGGSDLIAHWTLATATLAAIEALTRAAGFRYYFDAGLHQFVHPAGVLVATPDGHVAQYFFGVGFAAPAVRLALVDASEGKLGGVIDRLVLLCCGYDPATGRYTLTITRIMTWLGCAFVVAMLIGFAWLRRGPR